MKHYRLCDIYHGAPKRQKPSLERDWYVFYFFNKHFDQPDKKPLFVRQGRMKKGINRRTTIKDRMTEAKEVAAEMDAMLISGFNPYLSVEQNRKAIAGDLPMANYIHALPSHAYPKEVKVVGMPLNEALAWALESKRANNAKWRHKDGTLKFPSGYSGVVDYFKEVCRSKSLLDTDVNGFSVLNAREVIQEMVNRRDLGDHAYLKYKATLFTLFAELKDWEKIKENPFEYKSNKQKPKPKEKAAFSGDERMLVKNRVIETNERWYPMLMILFHTHIRPVEIFRLQIKHVNIESREIFLPTEITKSDRDRYTIITNSLVPYLELLNLQSYDPEMYLFGYDLDPEFRMPDLKKDRATVLRDRWTKMWQVKIKYPIEKGGLGIDKNQYWLKDEGMNAKSDAGLDLQSIRLQTGHTSSAHTDAYLSKDPRRKNTKDKLRNLDIDW